MLLELLVCLMIGQGSFHSSVGQLIETSSCAFLRRSSFRQHFFCSRRMLPTSGVQEPEGLLYLRIWGGISSGEITGLLAAIQSRVIACFCSGYGSNILVYADSGHLSNRLVFFSLSDALVAWHLLLVSGWLHFLLTFVGEQVCSSDPGR